MLRPDQDIEQWGPIDGNVLYASFWYRPSAGLIRKKWGIGWSDMIISVRQNEKFTAFWDKPGLEQEGIRAIKKWLLQPKKFKILHASYIRSRDNLVALGEQINGPIQESINGKIIKKWYEYEMDFWNDATVFEIINYASACYLRSLLADCVPPAEIENVLNVLLSPEEPSFHKKSEIELWRIAAKSKTIGKLRENVANYAKQWYWVDNSYLESKHLTANDFFRRIKKLTRRAAIKKIKEALGYYRQVADKKVAITKKYKFPGKTVRVIKLLSFCVSVQDERKAAYWKALAGLERLCRQAAARFRMKFDDVTLYHAEPWRELLIKAKRLSPQEKKNRREFIVFDTASNRLKFYTGFQAKQIANKFFQRSQVVESGTLRGIGVSKGLVKGRVKILLSPKFIDKLRIGEILVAPMTSPDFVIAMRKSKAVITDVGGMTSHAAVVSRELGVPCIVGTKIATRVLRDGMLVEVDANRGVVRIIK